RRLASQLSRELLPTLGRPTMTTLGTDMMHHTLPACREDRETMRSDRLQRSGPAVAPQFSRTRSAWHVSGRGVILGRIGRSMFLEGCLIASTHREAACLRICHA